jgi:hypothetical protein
VENASEPRPWEQKIAEKQTKIREGWAELADALETGAGPADVELAQQIRTFLDGLPMPLTERQQIEQFLRAATHTSNATPGLHKTAAREGLQAPSQSHTDKGASRFAMRFKSGENDKER